MAITFGCTCGKRFTVKNEHAGRQAKCPICGQLLTVPKAGPIAGHDSIQSGAGADPPAEAVVPPSPAVREESHVGPADVGDPLAQLAKASQRLSLSRHDAPPAKEPSAAVGWVIGALVTIPVMIILVVATTKPTYGGGVQIPWYVNLIGILVLCGVANAINRARRNRPSSGTAVTPLVLDSDDVATQTASQVDATAKGGYVAGRMHDSRWIVSSGEMAAIVKNPDAFDNVVAGREPQAAMSAAPGAMWFLVLGRESGVAFRQDGSQVWSVRPEGIAPSQLNTMVSSIDGRTQRIELDATCVAAWRADTWEGFCRAVNPKGTPTPSQLPARWALLVWSLSTRKDPTAWLRFKLPYGSIKDGLSQLCASPSELGLVIDRCGPKKVAKWVGEVAPEHLHTMGRALSAGAQAKAKSHLRTGVVLIIAGVVLAVFMTAVGMSTFNVSFRSIRNASGDTIGALLGMAAFGLLFVFIGIGVILYSRHMKKWATEGLDGSRKQ